MREGGERKGEKTKVFEGKIDFNTINSEDFVPVSPAANMRVISLHIFNTPKYGGM